MCTFIYNILYLINADAYHYSTKDSMLSIEFIDALSYYIKQQSLMNHTMKLVFGKLITRLYPLVALDKSISNPGSQTKIKIKSAEIFETIKQLTEQINKLYQKESSEKTFTNDLFELANLASTSNKYYKQYIKYKLKYIQLKNKLNI
jgi:hypothetical protein